MIAPVEWFRMQSHRVRNDRRDPRFSRLHACTLALLSTAAVHSLIHITLYYASCFETLHRPGTSPAAPPTPMGRQMQLISTRRRRYSFGALPLLACLSCSAWNSFENACGDAALSFPSRPWPLLSGNHGVGSPRSASYSGPGLPWNVVRQCSLR
jgi:hypothetical protein